MPANLMCCPSDGWLLTDAYAFGILLFQLIFGRRVLDGTGGHALFLSIYFTELQHIGAIFSSNSLKFFQTEPLVESLALHELIDDRIENR